MAVRRPQEHDCAAPVEVTLTRMLMQSRGIGRRERLERPGALVAVCARALGGATPPIVPSIVERVTPLQLARPPDEKSSAKIEVGGADAWTVIGVRWPGSRKTQVPGSVDGDHRVGVHAARSEPRVRVPDDRRRAAGDRRDLDAVAAARGSRARCSRRPSRPIHE